MRTQLKTRSSSVAHRLIPAAGGAHKSWYMGIAMRMSVMVDEKQLSDVLTVPWTVDVNPNQLYAYAADGYAKESLGSCIAR